MKKSKGKIIPNGVILEKHEYKTILLFTEMGANVELIPKSNKKWFIRQILLCMA